MKRTFTLLLAVAMVAGAAPLSGQQVPIIDRDLLFGDPEIAGAQISPDGRFISFIKPHLGVMNIWVKERDEPFDAAQPITADTTRPVTGYFWSEDSRFVLYVQDKGGNENYHVYAVDPAGPAEEGAGVPAARDLTPFEDARAFIYAVPEATPQEIIVGLNDRDPQWHDVYRVNIDTGDRTLVLENRDQIAQWTVDLAGEIRLGVRTTAAGGSEILRVDGEGLSVIYACGPEETCAPLRFQDDGTMAYAMTNRGDRDLIELVLLDPMTGAETFVERDPEGQADFGGAGFSDVTNELEVTVYVGDTVRIYPKTEQFQRDLDVLRSKLPPGQLGMSSTTEDETLVIVAVSRDVDPGSVYLYNRTTGDVDLLYRTRPDLPSDHLPFRKPVRYTARDGLEIPAYLTLPRGVEPRGLATVILPHGGPWARDLWGYDPYAAFLANRGYAVLQPNFRGSTGYGKAFLNGGNGEWGTGAMQHDISDGVAWLIDQGIADPDRVAIFGGSYGGYATLAGLAFTPELYAAGISYVGPSNIITLLNSIPPYWAAIRNIFNVRVGDPEDPEDRQRLMEQSPLFSAEKITAPLLVVQGANDPRVKKRESEQIVVALREMGRGVEYMLAEDEGHGFAGRENRLALAVAMERFFAKHLGGRLQEDVKPDVAAKLEQLTVDVHSVEISQPPVSAAAAATAPMPKVNGDWIEPGSMTYGLTIQAMGQEIPVTIARTIEEASLDGRAVWRVIDEIQSAMGGGTDTLDIDRVTLMPVRRGTGGQAAVALNFREDGVSGEIRLPGQTLPIDASFEAPTLADGAGSQIFQAGFALDEEFEGIVRVFEVQGQRVRPFRVAVTGTETVTTAAGTFDTFVLEITPLDDDESGTSTVHVMREGPHYMVKATTKLPPQMGSGTGVSELTSISPAASE